MIHQNQTGEFFASILLTWACATQLLLELYFYIKTIIETIGESKRQKCCVNNSHPILVIPGIFNELNALNI